MRYRVVLARSAQADADDIFQWVIERAPVRGAEWFSELIDSLSSLEVNPYRCPLAREAARARRPIRSLLFGKRRNTYRILFEIDDTSYTVSILHIRHGAMYDIRPEDLAQP